MSIRDCAQSIILSIQFALAVSPCISNFFPWTPVSLPLNSYDCALRQFLYSGRRRKANKKGEIPLKYPQSLLNRRTVRRCAQRMPSKRLNGIERLLRGDMCRTGCHQCVEERFYLADSSAVFSRQAIVLGDQVVPTHLRCCHYIKSPGYQSPSQIVLSCSVHFPTQALPPQTISLPPLAFLQHQDCRLGPVDHSRNPRPFHGQSGK